MTEMTAQDDLNATAADQGWTIEPGSWAFERVYRKSRRTYLRVTFDARGRVIEGGTATRRLPDTGKREQALAILKGQAR